MYTIYWRCSNCNGIINTTTSETKPSVDQTERIVCNQCGPDMEHSIAYVQMPDP